MFSYWLFKATLTRSSWDFLVIRLITPPAALLPYCAESAPSIISIRSKSVKRICDKSIFPLRRPTTGTPSMSIWTFSPPIPWMRTPLPKIGSVPTWKLSCCDNTSAKLTMPWRWISSASITWTWWIAFLDEVGANWAVTTISSKSIDQGIVSDSASACAERIVV